MKRLILSILAVFGTALMPAVAADDEVTFDLAAPTVVEVGELFRIEFIVNAIETEFTAPTFEGFEVLAGPTETIGQDISIINGKTTFTKSTTYTYVIQAFTPGLHTISAARITLDDKSYSTEPLTIEVVGDAASGGERSGGEGTAGGNQSQTGQGSALEIADDQIFLRAVVSRSEVYKDEPVTITLKLYSRVQPFVFDALDKVPTFNGFWLQDITSDRQPLAQREAYQNRAYDSWVLKEYLLYPQQSGTLTIDPFEATVSVQFRTRGSTTRDFFDEFMGGGNVQTVRKKIATQPLHIEVRPLPAGAPESFKGTVGEFTLSMTPPASAMNTNTSGSYTLRLEGTGNFPLIRTPDLDLPDSFEEYNVTTSDNTRHQREGTSGYREFSYPFIPRTEGLYTIPSLEFSFFDPKQKSYVTLTTRETSIEVVADTTTVVSTGGLVSGVSREEMKVLGQDIRFIKRGKAGLHPKGRVFMWSPLFVALVALLAAGFVVGFVVLRSFVRNMQSDRFVRSKRANKMALRRFKAAGSSMAHGDEHGFYNEMLKALWGYMGDRLDIPMAALTKERIREELFERSIDETLSRDYIRIISECEEAQYSPSSSARMGELYREGVAVVSELESAIKRK